MKTSITKLKTSLLILSIFISAPSFAKVVAKVMEVKGNVFAILPEGKTIKVVKGLHLAEKSELLVEEDSTATFYDFYDTTYHLNGGAHIKVEDKNMHLKGGKVWIQSTHMTTPLNIITANAIIDFTKSEFITSFDQASGKSQVMVVNGTLDVSNILDRNFKSNLTTGAFTVVDPNVNEGQPRKPTMVGADSLKAAIADFKVFPDAKAKNGPEVKREVASVEEAAPEKAPETKKPDAPAKGELVFIQTTRLPASVDGKDDEADRALKYFKMKLRRQVAKKAVSAITVVPIRVYGSSVVVTPKSVTKKLVSAVVERIPASTQATKMIEDSNFTDSLNNQIQTQPRHSTEVQHLIDDLKSF